MSSFDVVTAILCDDVRREMSGSAVIVGARIIGEPVPRDTDTKLQRFFLYFEAEVQETPSVHLRIINEESEDEVFSQKIEIDEPELPEGGKSRKDFVLNMVLVLSPNEVVVSGPGVYLVQFKAPGEKWITCKKILFPELDEE